MSVAVLEARPPRTSGATVLRKKATEQIIPPIQTRVGTDWNQILTGSSYFLVTPRTSSQPSSPLPTPLRLAAAAIHEIRRTSGLNWEELAQLFKVTRRTLHYWANGENLSRDNIARVHRVLFTLRRLDRRDASETRLALLTPDASGTRPLDFLAQDQLNEAVTAFLATPRSHIPPSPHPDTAAPHPAELMGALTDHPFPQSGGLVPDRSRRLPKRRP